MLTFMIRLFAILAGWTGLRVGDERAKRQAQCVEGGWKG